MSESTEITHPAWSAFRARVNNRLALHLPTALFRLRNPGPMVSFTFDDAPVSSVSVGAAMIEEYNARATYYIAGGLADSWSGHWTNIGADDIVGLHRRGHEIACHTFSHVRAPDLTAAAIAADIEKNRRYLLALDPSMKLENFAYPYGLASISRKRQFRKTFRSSRGIMPGVNRGTVDLQCLRAMPLVDQHLDNDGVERVFDQTIATNGWLIFYGHDITATPSPYGCSPSLLRHALDAASRRRIPVLTVADALRQAGAYR